jgi:hypothetical protein
MARASCVTASEIARILGASVVRVRHVLATRNIEPAARAGLVRVYDATAIARVRRELAAIDERQAVRSETTTGQDP